MLELNYKEELGTIKDECGRTHHIYRGNCLAGTIYKIKHDGTTLITLSGFWTDAQHLKRCLGLTGAHKGDNIYKDWKKISLNTRYPEAIQIATAFAKAKAKTKIELYYK